MVAVKYKQDVILMNSMQGIDVAYVVSIKTFMHMGTPMGTVAQPKGTPISSNSKEGR